jgi:cobalamin biosynthesis Mg chelatase CobN
MSPNVSSYEQTLPGYVCREYIDQCVNSHPNDLDGITACRATQCGTKLIGDPDDSTSSSSSASASATASSTSSGSSSDASETASSTSGGDSASQTSDNAQASATDNSSAASALTLASNYGTGLLAVGILAAFGLAL